jgi:hypothetical protein
MIVGDPDGFSRIYGGIHFQHGNLDGQAQGAALRAIVDALDWHR